MPKARDIRRRIRSVRSTQKITKTMEMMAASKLKRVQGRLLAARPYAARLRALVGDLAATLPAGAHPFLTPRPERRSITLLLLTSSRGLCGAFNANLIKVARAQIEEAEAHGTRVRLSVSGRKGIAFFRYVGYPVARSYAALPEIPGMGDVEELAEGMGGLFLSGAVDEVRLVYSLFRSPVEQRPTVEVILPVPATPGTPATGRGELQYIVEPSLPKLLDHLLPLSLRAALRMALLESSASEQGARRTAMKNATDNADDMIASLVRSYNKARQAQITQEIAEVVGGAEALRE